jgi:hypothetical protein
VPVRFREEIQALSRPVWVTRQQRCQTRLLMPAGAMASVALS